MIFSQVSNKRGGGQNKQSGQKFFEKLIKGEWGWGIINRGGESEFFYIKRVG